jgi:hypothetical protein
MPFEEQSFDVPESEAIALMKKRLKGFETEKGRLRGLSYVPHNKDEVVITTTPKAGTTWTQQVRNSVTHQINQLLKNIWVIKRLFEFYCYCQFQT